MRFQRLDLLSYGHFTDRSIEFPTSDVDIHILFGRNEAGKSTALSAVEDLLFGIPTQSPYGFLHDYSNMRIGAVLESVESTLEVIRRKGTRNTLLDTEGSPLAGGEEILRPFIASADRSFFERMFSLDHVRLEAGGQEILTAKDEIGQILFSAGSGIVGLRDRLEGLLKEADELWAPRRAGHRKYYQAEDRLKVADKALREHTLNANEWRKLKRAFVDAEAAHSEIDADYEKLAAEGRRLSRIRRVYRHVREKTELVAQIETLGKVITLPEDAGTIFETSERQVTDASTRIRTLTGQLDEAKRDIDELDYDANLVLRADDVFQLHERRIEIRGEKADLPKREAELEALEIDLRGLATELEWSETEVNKVIAQIPSRAKVKITQTLLGQRSGFVSNVGNRTQALREAELEASELEEQLEGTDETLTASGLKAVVASVREAGDLSGRLLDAKSQAKVAQDRVERFMASLHPAVSDGKKLAEVRVPPQLSVQNFRDQLLDRQRENRDLDNNIFASEQKLNDARKAFEKAVSHEEVVTIAELEEARHHRDSLWRLVKLKHIDGAPISDPDLLSYAEELDDLAEAFEPANRQADRLADQRFDDAEAAGRLAEMSRVVEEQEDGLQQLCDQRDRHRKIGEDMDAEWSAMWDDAPFEPLNTDAMLEWMDQRNDLLEAIGQSVAAAATVARCKEEEAQATESLLKELASFGVDIVEARKDSLSVLVERASNLQQDCELRAQRKSQLEENAQEQKIRIERRRDDLSRAEAELSEWNDRWSEALSELGLSGNSATDAVAPKIEIIDQVREKAARITELRNQRIEKIKRDIVGFESSVAEFIRDLAGDLSGMAAEDAVLKIEERLDEATRIRELLTIKSKSVADLEEKVAESEDERQTARALLTSLLEAAEVEATEQLKAAITKSDTLRERQTQLADIVRVLEREGDGLTIDELTVDCADVDIDEVTVREETVVRELEELRRRLTEKAELRSEARSEFEAIGGDDAAALAAAERQEALSEMREVAERYVRVRTSAMLLQWAIDKYREKMHAPLLKRASELFETITDGSFADLRIDYDDRDQAHLAGRRENQEIVRVSGMSTGTADQLYFALRLASIEDYLERAEGLPFIADDLFINFDNDRARAGFRVLAALAERSQVLFFTHHRHLVDIARETLGGLATVHSLNEGDELSDG